MTRFALTAAFALAAILPASATNEMTPSFDCAKASTRVEKMICEAPGSELMWYDRQLASVYALALSSNRQSEAALKAAQSAWLKKRDACKADDWECVAKAYRARIADLAESAGSDELAAGFFNSDQGDMALVRYPRGRVAIMLLTVGDNGHSCTFSTDKGKEDRAGNFVWSGRPDEGDPSVCTITIAPEGNVMSVTSTTETCTYFCGMRAVLDGNFGRTAP